MTPDVEINAIMSDPEFDPVQYFKNIDLHTRLSKLTNKLLDIPGIFIALIESPYYQFLESEPRWISGEVFEQLFDAEYEMWTKTGSGNNRWYGLILGDHCICYFKKIRYTNKIVIDKPGRKNHKDAAWWRKEWARLGLYNMKGGAPKDASQIDLTRGHLKTLFQKLGYEGSWRQKASDTKFRMRKWNPRHLVQLTVMAKGNRCHIKAVEGDTYYGSKPRLEEEITIQMKDDYKLTARAILNWASSLSWNEALKGAIENTLAEV
jgi:hypothetical protein